MAHMLPADSAFAMLTCCTLCRRPLRGRIVEPKNFPHIVVGSAGRAFHRFGGRGGPREAVAFGCGHCVLRPCSARMAQRRRRACFGALVRVWGRASLLPLACYVLYDVYGSGTSRNFGHGT